jgi:hypothetical protein
MRDNAFTGPTGPERALSDGLHYLNAKKKALRHNEHSKLR